MSRTIVVVLHPHRVDARSAALEVCRTLDSDGIRPVMLETEYRALVAYTGVPDTEIQVVPDAELDCLAEGCELVMVLGGDGTILKAAERFHRSGVPIMGVNLGHVGFLAESEREDLAEAVHRASARDYIVEERMALDITVYDRDAVIHRTWALNEATIEKSEDCRMIDLVLGVDSRPVSSFGCDGVILATPTGSTAYGFSAGGPIVWPDVEALLMVPISAHALFAKPLVVSPAARLGVEFLPSAPGVGAVLWCDGRREIDVPPGARIEAARARTPVALARLNTSPFTDRLVAKFHLPVTGWRGPVRNPQ
ncbi:NAD kinase [Nocardia zapadnayensis]|uniref:NAD kinase n=1 Tax=unclassified Brevibacterium TaxID=2614124 RepID=UPI001FFC264C|nr:MULTISPECIES: NAD kinase [Actinomycetes]MCK1804043.1 NAD kinase [Brevibacterium sp. R8603A2]MCX0276539.1 NAD kinase [Nocardia zapadnayensis]